MKLLYVAELTAEHLLYNSCMMSSVALEELFHVSENNPMMLFGLVVLINWEVKFQLSGVDIWKNSVPSDDVIVK